MNWCTKFINRLSLYILGYTIYILSFFSKRDKKLWVFGAWLGEKYSDNAKYVFEFVNKNYKDIRCIWLTKNKKILRYLRAKGFESYLSYRPSGIYHLLKAKGVIVSTGIEDVNAYVNNKTIVFQLWHGTPLKKIKYDDEKELRRTGDFFLLMDKVFFPLKFRKYDYGFATSEEVKNKFASGLRIEKDRIFVTGYPRNDAMLQAKPPDDEILRSILDKKKQLSANKIIFYLPTHRKEGSSDIPVLSYKQLKKVDSFLEQNDSIMLIKLHHFYANKLAADGDFKRIINLKDEIGVLDIYPLLRVTDILITDYSSMFFDFLLLDRPIIFFPYDYNEYLRDERSFYYNYADVTPGPKAYSWNDVMKLISTVDRWDPEYKKFRARVSKIFNKYIDGYNTERVVNIIKNILSN